MRYFLLGLLSAALFTFKSVLFTADLLDALSKVSRFLYELAYRPDLLNAVFSSIEIFIWGGLLVLLVVQKN